ncbi:hypothetical protein Tco_0444181, partial [Tanacetum coccineum]
MERPDKIPIGDRD